MAAKHSKIILVITILGAAASFLYLAIKAIYDPGIPFLTTRHNANWILYPFRPELVVRAGDFTNLTTEFTKSFELPAKPCGAYLYVRAFDKYCLWINDNQVPDSLTGTNWKKVHVSEISPFLEQGKNTVRVRVSNKCGPPALWLYTRGLQDNIKTDTSWTAASALDGLTASAGLADDCFIHPISLQGIRPFDALSRKLLITVLFFFFSLAVFWLCNLKLTLADEPVPWRFLLFTPKHVLALCILLWIIIFINNLPKIAGFDSNSHLEYIDYILNQKSIPLANEGWETYQPPLFYVASAVVLSLSRLFLDKGYTLYSLKLIPFFCGMGQIWIAFFTSRLVFPCSKTKQSLSTAAAAIIPMNIYMSNYLSNESAGAMLMAMAIFVTVIMLESNQNSSKYYCILGLVIGMALLAKFTILTILPAIFLVLVYKSFSKEKNSFFKSGRNFFLMFLIIVVSAGWFYARNWVNFGKALVANWDHTTIMPWWQDPGFHTYKYFCSFGRVFTTPYYAGTYSLFDSLYSTFWGDGFLGGMGIYAYRPPWNYEYMSLAYFLAAPAMLVFLVGTILAIREIVRTANKIWLLMLGSLFTMAFSIVHVNLQIPHYSSAKAFYGLGVILPISLVFAYGFDHLDKWMKDRKLSFLRMILYGWFGALTFTVFLSLFARPN